MADYNHNPKEEVGLGENASVFSPHEAKPHEGTELVDNVTVQNVTQSRIFVSVDGVDFSSKVAWESLSYSKQKGGNRDTFTFQMKNPDFELVGLEEVLIKYGIDFATSEPVFGGVVTKTQQSFDGLIKTQTVEGADFSWKLDKKLVVGEFSGNLPTVIADIMAFAPNDFTIGSVTLDAKVDRVRFNYVSVSEALTELCDLFLLEWYVDTDKRLHISQPRPAPFEMEDENDSHLWNSLRLSNDYEQIKNSIIVRGGEFVSNIESEEHLDTQVDGENTVFTLGYRYRNPQVFFNTGDWNERKLTLGLDNIDSFVTNDVLYNYNEKVLRFPEDTPPLLTDRTVTFKGYRKLPIRIALTDDEAVTNLGGLEFEFLIIDRTIESQAVALERARAELNRFSEEIVDVHFQTFKDFLDTGQTIRLNSSLRGVDENFTITSLTAQAVDPFKFIYSVAGITQKKMNFIDIMRKLLLQQSKNIVISDDEVLTLIVEFKELIKFDDTDFEFTTDGAWTWVVGPYVPSGPSDTNRSVRADTGAVVQS